MKLQNNQIFEHQVEIFNLFFKTIVFLDLLKIAKVIPIQKKLKVSNYTLISLLFNFHKIFEKLVDKRLMHLLDKKTVLQAKGFQKGFPTSHAINYCRKKVCVCAWVRACKCVF